MNGFFVPYAGDRPATVEINGHRLVFTSASPEQLEESLDLVGGDRVCETSVAAETDPAEQLQTLSRSLNAQVVITPPEADLRVVFEHLADSLPWLH